MVLRELTLPGVRARRGGGSRTALLGDTLKPPRHGIGSLANNAAP